MRTEIVDIQKINEKNKPCTDNPTVKGFKGTSNQEQDYFNYP